ncbi:oestrogen-responsive protein [Diaporthe eres]|nr:oestrogen-responsive protein [Diaporthe eres]
MAWTNVNYLPLVNKARRPKFDIYDLNNVPLVQGVSLIKWHLPHSIHGEHRGRTAKCPIANHRVEYGYGKVIPVRIGIDKNNNLSECLIEFEVLQEFSTHGVTGRSETITLGKVTLNLSEYVEESETVVREAPFRSGGPSVGSTTNGSAGNVNAASHARKRSSLSQHTPITPDSNVSPTSSALPSKPTSNEATNNKAPSINEPAPEQHVQDGVIRRYLMQDSKINSTLKIGILMLQVDGERNFSAPPLKTAAVFGGIAGMVAEAAGGAGGAAAAADSGVAEFGHLHLQDDTQDPSSSNLSAQFSLGKNNGKSRDVYELQDMYRRALAASWACQPGELPADECIEDIFEGGDGFGEPDGDSPIASPSAAGDATPRGHHSHHTHHSHHRSRHSLSRFGRRLSFRREDSGSAGDDEFLRPSDRRGLGGQKRQHSRHGSGESAHTVTARHDHAPPHHGGLRGPSGHRRDGSKDSGRPPSSAGMRGRSESLSSLAATIESERGRSGFKSAREVNEFDVREDMVAWKLPDTAVS